MRLFKPGGGIEELEDITPELIAEVCRVHVTTARRWKRGEMPPFTALKIINLYKNGELGEVDLRWHNWKLRNGLLISDDGSSFTPGQVRAIPFMEMQIDSYKRDQRSVRQADWISGEWKPAPEQEDIVSVA